MFGLETLFGGAAKDVVETATTGIRGIITAFKMPPEEAAKFEQAMHELTTKLISQSMDIAQKSQQGAREREMALKDDTPRVLTYIYTGLFVLLILGQVIAGYLGHELHGSVQRTLDQFTGVLFAWVSGSREYYLGTSLTEVSSWARSKLDAVRGPEK